ncbi:MAG: ABC transporter ATP-binding protein [bacterium]|nr:ABC transporter ATP-binding protein [bacterium]
MNDKNSNPNVLIDIRNLKTFFYIEKQAAPAVGGVSFQILEGEVFGLVGESGSGKSVTAQSIMRLIPDPPGKIVEGEILLRGVDILKLPLTEMRKIRGKEIGMIFQEPMTSLNPVFTIGFQLREIVLTHEKVSKEEANRRAAEMLEMVGIPDASKRLNDYPHQFSGGMRQRVMIAMALANNPSLLIADEPTTALDVTIQAQILELMLEVKAKRKDAAILLITHDLAVIAETCQRVAVMYGGMIQEIAPVFELFENPAHPYTRGLIASLPSKSQQPRQKLRTIPGIVPSIFELPKGCKFCTRCEVKIPICEQVEPPLIQIAEGHYSRCHLNQPGKDFQFKTDLMGVQV